MPLFMNVKNAKWWILRYLVNGTTNYWYICDCNKLDRDAGDLYRVKSDADMPPTNWDMQGLFQGHTYWDCAKDGRRPAPTLRFVAEEVSMPRTLEPRRPDSG